MKSSKRNKKILKFIRVIVICVLSLSMVIFCAIFIAHSFVFSRADYDQYDTEHYLLYEDIDVEKVNENTRFIESVLNKYLYSHKKILFRLFIIRLQKVKD